MTTTRFLPVLFLPFALAACASDTSVLDPAAITTSRPPASSVSPQPSAPASTPPASPPRPTPPPASPPRSTPPRATPPAARPSAPASSAPAGATPRAEITGDDNSLSKGQWTLRVTTRQGVVTGDIVAEPQMRPKVLGLVDADRDGDHEIFVSVTGGASTTTYAVFTVVEDGAAEVRHTDGTPLRLVVGGTVTHGDGFGCPAGTLVVRSVTSADGATYRGTETSYSWRDDVVTRTGRTTFTGNASDPRVTRASGIECGGMRA